jgi:hypothetical protein
VFEKSQDSGDVHNNSHVCCNRPLSETLGFYFCLFFVDCYRTLLEPSVVTVVNTVMSI